MRRMDSSRAEGGRCCWVPPSALGATVGGILKPDSKAGIPIFPQDSKIQIPNFPAGFQSRIPNFPAGLQKPDSKFPHHWIPKAGFLIFPPDSKAGFLTSPPDSKAGL